ncbi:MAG TPA: ribonuclease HII [Alphaproteobacteria bacterium]|nr:ribonuclease HII [Alphaproteobacteria bacterium]HNS44843.1 ribonuclease HII [Alphaproteobacteria bacterium]
MGNRPTFEIENSCGHPIVYGVDEVGRGPLAGPVVAAAVYIPHEKRNHPVWKEVRDSKQISEVKREILFPIIQSQSVFGMGMANVEEIDEINILQATFLAMRRAIESCAECPDMLLIDGNRSPKNWPWDARTVVKGDSVSVSIAAASILAKVTRDKMMAELAAEFPAYGWADNAGYGTPAHLDALNRFGATPHHRKSFAPVKNLLAA